MKKIPEICTTFSKGTHERADEEKIQTMLDVFVWDEVRVEMGDFNNEQIRYHLSLLTPMTL